MDVVDSFEDPRPERPEALPETLVVDLDGYEGPLDVLLGLAREQKVEADRGNSVATHHAEVPGSHDRDARRNRAGQRPIPLRTMEDRRSGFRVDPRLQ